MHGRADRPSGYRKTRDRALVLPLVGIVLLMLPAGGILPPEARIGGIPFALAYVFAVWAGLIAGAALLSRRLAQKGAAPDSPEARDE